MYAIYHQIDREKREQEEKVNEQNLVEELKQLEAKYNLLVRRDSYSTITTHDTEIIIETKTDRKHQLLPITWAKNGKLPVEISVPETTRRKDQNLLDNHENDEDDDGEVDIGQEAYDEPLPEQKDDDALRILQSTLFVDDEEELDLIFDDNQEDEMNIQRTLGTPTPHDVSLSSCSKSLGTPTPLDENPTFSDSSESLYTDPSASSCGSSDEDLVRFESQRFTRFEI